MNRLFYYKDICTYHIFPFLGPKLFQLHELRSVSRHWSSLIISPNRLYIRVSPDSYPNLSNAYDIICNLIDSKDDIDIPEIWLEEGTHLNTIPVINYPIIIRGIGRKESIINLYHPILGDYPNRSPKIEHPLVKNRIVDL